MDWTGLITQLPALAAFIWYSIKMQERFDKSMEQRDAAYLGAINKIADKLEAHDNRVDARIEAATNVKSRPRKVSQ